MTTMPMKLTRKTAKVPVLDNSTMCMSGTKPEMTAMRMEPQMVIKYGVWKVG